MRYYIVDNNGTVLGEADTLERAKRIMCLRYTQDEITAKEIEIIEGQ